MTTTGRTLLAGSGTSPVILHVPHSSRVVPDEIRRALLVTDAQLCEAAYAAFADLREITTNSPFAGTYVPLSRHNTDRRVSSVMIELRRDQYTNIHGAPDTDSIEHIAAMLARLVDAADRASG